MTRRRRSAGFTLIELLIAMALAGMVVAGALELHASFNRQAERQNMIAEMQQNLRVSMLILERAIRQAGYGIPMGQLNEAGTGATSPITRHFGFQFSQSNVYQDPITTFQKVARGATADTDPDWFYVTYANNSNVFLTSGATGQFTVKPTLPTAQDLSLFNDHMLLGFSVNKGGNASGTDSSCVCGLAQTSCGCVGVDREDCVREISANSNHGGSATVKVLLHDNSAANVKYAFNPPSTTDDCSNSIAKIQANSGDSGVMARLIPNTITAYRVIPATGDVLSTGAPKLAMRSAPFKTPYNDSTYHWTVIAENIDDMQIALIEGDFPTYPVSPLDPVSNAAYSAQGRVCWQTDDVDQATGCPPQYAVGVRITLSARSSSPVPGVTQDTFPGGEDRPKGGSAASDIGYLHRSLTATIDLRNMRTQTPLPTGP